MHYARVRVMLPVHMQFSRLTNEISPHRNRLISSSGTCDQTMRETRHRAKPIHETMLAIYAKDTQVAILHDLANFKTPTEKLVARLAVVA